MTIINISNTSYFQLGYLNSHKHAKEILPLFQHALSESDDSGVQTQLKSYEYYEIFKGADFFVRHGAMHACHVAISIILMVNFYKIWNDARAQNMSQQEIEGLIIGAFFHDYGRVVEKADLTNDYHEMEEIGANKCYQYLIDHNFGQKIAQKVKNALLNKDEKSKGPDFEEKDIFSELLQNSDCLAVQRADDWKFNQTYLDVLRRLEEWGKNQWLDQEAKDQVKEELFQIIDETKKYLVSLSDSPQDFTPLSKKYEKEGSIKGRFSIIEKRKIERAVDCFEIMEKRIADFPTLNRIYHAYVWRGVPGIYELSERCTRIFDASIENICRLTNNVLPKLKDEIKEQQKKYLYVMTLTQTDEEVVQAVNFLKQNESFKNISTDENWDNWFRNWCTNQHWKDTRQICKDFIKKIKKLTYKDQIEMEIIRRTKGVGEMRFHLTNNIALPHIIINGLSFDKRTFDRDKFLEVAKITSRIGLRLFPLSQTDVQNKKICASSILDLDLSYGLLPEWLRLFLSGVGISEMEIPTSGSEVTQEQLSQLFERGMKNLQEMLKRQQEQPQNTGKLTDKEIELIQDFTKEQFEIYAKKIQRIMIVCKRDKGNAECEEKKLKQFLLNKSGIKIDRSSQEELRRWEDSFEKKLFSEEGDCDESWYPTSLSETEDLSFLNAANLDFFKL